MAFSMQISKMVFFEFSVILIENFMRNILCVFITLPIFSNCSMSSFLSSHDSFMIAFRSVTSTLEFRGISFPVRYITYSNGWSYPWEGCKTSRMRRLIVLLISRNKKRTLNYG